MASIVDLLDVKAHLNITSPEHDDELTRLMDAATAFVERHVGPVVPQTVTETVVPAGDRIFLSAPVISLTSMTTAYGYPGTYTVGNWTAAEGAQLIASYGTALYPYPVTVVYEGGYSTVPADLYEATLDYIKWRWLSQRGPTPLPVPGDEFAVVPSATVPNRVMEIIDGYRLPGIA